MNSEEKVVTALNSADKVESLYQVALSLKLEGFSQKELYALFDLFREKHEDEQDSTKHDAILDVMDYISGYCPLKYAIFGENTL